MKKILVPIDFSDNAKAALLYAIKLAKELDTKVKAVHVYHPTTSYVNEWMTVSSDDMIKFLEERLSLFVQENLEKALGKSLSSGVEEEVSIGFAGEKLVEMSQSDEFDLIVMGTTGSSGLLEKIFGKVSSHVSQEAACPVLLIPSHVEFYRIQHIMYASEYDSANENTLLQISNYSNLFKADVHLVHVYNEGNKNAELLGHDLLKQVFEEKAPWLKFKMASVKNDSVAHGLEKYAVDNNIDWMVLVKPHLSFWEKLTRKNHTNEIIMNPQIPLMIMH